MADTDESTENETKKGGGLMGVLPLVVIAAAGTFGMVWWSASPPPPPPPVTAEACEAIAPKEDVPVEELAARAAKYITLDPLMVSLGPDAGADHLRMGIALGVPATEEELTDVQFLRLRDRFIERLRVADTSLLIEPEALPALKEDLLAQARATLGADAVQSVLVTDFLLK